MPSATAVVTKLQVYGELASVQMVVQVLVPVGAYWNLTSATPEPKSVAVPVMATVPCSGAGSAVRVAVAGAVLSIRREVTAAEVVVLFTPSVATARRS